MVISNIIKKLHLKSDLNNEDLLTIFHDFSKKNVNNEDIKNLVLAWKEKGETAHELKQLADLLNNEQNQKSISEEAIDMCGTGGDKANTFNVSTLAAIVSSASGVKVIKHSGRSTTSISGSVDILNQFGFDFDAASNVKEICFKKTNMMFVGSKVLRDVFGSVKSVCRELGFPGFVNLLGPLTNPYKTSYHLLGVSNIKWGELLASTLLLQGKKDAMVVCSKINDQICLDELSFCGTNYIWRLTGGKIKTEKIEPKDLEHESVNLNDLTISDMTDSKKVFEDLLVGRLKKSPKAEIVALNAGAALYLAKKAKSIMLGYDIALRNINSGIAWEHLQIFLNCNKKE